MSSRLKLKKKAFSLIELVTVIALIGIVSSVTTPIFSGTFQQYVTYSKRLALMHQIEFIDNTLTKIVENAVPHSIRWHEGGGNTWLILTPISQVIAFKGSDLDDTGKIIDNAYYQDLKTLNLSDPEYFIFQPEAPGYLSSPISSGETRFIYDGASSKSRIGVTLSDQIEYPIALTESINTDTGKKRKVQKITLDKSLGANLEQDIWHRGYIASKPYAFKCSNESNIKELRLYYGLIAQNEGASPSIDDSIPEGRSVIATNVEKCKIEYSQFGDTATYGYVEVFIQLEQGGVKSPPLMKKIRVRNAA